MESRDVASAEDLFRKCADEKAILEEVVVQNSEMAAFHAKSLNTLRVVTLRDKRRDIHVMGAAFRMGTGDEVVDNFHKQGVVAVIDVDTGLVKSTATNYQHKRFVVHPDTGLPIVGFRIPHFDKVVQTVTAAAERLPEMDMVGWDVAIDRNDNVVLIEGNSLPDFDVLQIGEQGGVYDQFRPYIDERRAG